MPDPDPKYVEFAKAVETLLGRESPETPETPAAATPAPAPTPPAGEPAPAALPEEVAVAAAEIAAQGGPGELTREDVDALERQGQGAVIKNMDKIDAFLKRGGK